jgi:hypothetical protein
MMVAVINDTNRGEIFLVSVKDMTCCCWLKGIQMALKHGLISSDKDKA